MAGNSGEPGRTVTSKLAAILVAFANGRDFTLSELAMHTNLAISTVHRLLTDLVRTSLLERPDGITYRPGPALHEMLPYVVAPPTLRERAPFVVEDLATSLRATARFGIVDGLEVGYIEKAPRAEPGTLFPNAARLPLHATAMGKALLAFGPRSLTRLVHGSGLPRYTARTLACPVELEHDLQKARTHGFAVSDGELAPGATAVAVPVFDAQRRAVAAVEVDVAHKGRDAVELALPALLVAARCLRREVAPALRLDRAIGPQNHASGAALVRLQA
jgi:IclR family transcriptional regulator, acetate operon repressor